MTLIPSPAQSRKSAAAKLVAVVGILAGALAVFGAGGTDIDRPPISYDTAPENNAVARLRDRLDDGKATLAYDDEFGYLPALLNELKVPKSSQTLVFSKTSLQRQRIRPRAPRALYFNDDVYVGYCHQGDLMEISVADPQLGTAFYTLDQKPGGKPHLERQTDTCLLCHSSSQNQGLPGHLMRSLYVDGEGLPILASGSYRTDQASPFNSLALFLAQQRYSQAGKDWQSSLELLAPVFPLNVVRKMLRPIIPVQPALEVFQFPHGVAPWLNCPSWVAFREGVLIGNSSTHPWLVLTEG